ncbi:hypothetical protein [Sphingomonas nostoxanthinifaciens]|uniref:hypothetical protein n=1 Tax=Sphingomonas nostoxanthinifaciens TaxID=2872652 RepID=UPI001CC1FBDD|nr:hypothetical protein [Sphingomonas nostoxanthinifaciens]UAK26009.1 hypothetical protein K8P63_07830 [Sphingomonas nostoxanthinifaciens]
MSDPLVTELIVAAALLGLVVVTFALLRGWREWIALQRLSIEGPRAADGPPPGTTGARIELADLRERVRKLEAIAAGIDL